MSNATMSDVFKAHSRLCLKINSACVNECYNDGVTAYDAIDLAVSVFDDNQVLIKKQQEQIELLLDVVTHFNRSSGDLNPLLTAYIDIKNNKSTEKAAS